jgi:diguanylate cyclase
MFDLDHFGSLNKSYGLPFGDRIIVDMSRKFREVFADEDILVRYGGDEFTFIFPDSPVDEVHSRCENLCTALRAMRFEEHPELSISCSIGLASYPDYGTSLADLKEAADGALYKAKEEGRDRVVLFSPDNV